MQDGERRTNYEQRQLSAGQCTNFSLHTSLLRKSLANGEQRQLPGDSAPLLALHRKIRGAPVMEMQLPAGAVRDFNPLRKIRELRVMENHHDGSYHHWLPGSGVLNKHGDAEA